jgi:hypothetical protein
MFENSEGLTEYEDGASARWCWELAANRFDVDGFAPRADAAVLLGCKANCTFRGFNAGPGVMMLDAVQGSEPPLRTRMPLMVSPNNSLRPRGPPS